MQNKTLTVLEGIKLSTDYLDSKGIESARINAELMLSHILKCKRLDLYLSFDRPLLAEEIDILRKFISRRGQFEPLQYILGEVEFYGLTFNVSPDVLIPRPETELLVEETLNIIKENDLRNILDIGTGSGNIPIALAANSIGLNITAIDLSEKAIRMAIKNAKLNGVEDKIEYKAVSIQEFSSNRKYDLVVSNPPYVSANDYVSVQNEIKNYEPKEAVTDNGDGYDFYKMIVRKSDAILRQRGFLLFEIAQGQSSKISDLMNSSGFEHVRVINDYQSIDRIVIGQKK